MESRWKKLKPEAIRLRMEGISIRSVEIELGIPRSTLSGWFRDVELSTRKKARLQKEWRDGLIAARKKAVIWHNNQKAERVALAAAEAGETLKKLGSSRKEIIELALALLYLGEGSKKNDSTSLGNSDPLILKFFVNALQKVYGVPLDAMKCEIHLRADQNPEEIKKYWSAILNIPLSNFGKPLIDLRTKGKPTYAHYKGVCAVRCSRVAIQRKLLYIAKGFCEEIANTNARA